MILSSLLKSPYFLSPIVTLSWWPCFPLYQQIISGELPPAHVAPATTVPIIAILSRVDVAAQSVLLARAHPLLVMPCSSIQGYYPSNAPLSPVASILCFCFFSGCLVGWSLLDCSTSPQTYQYFNHLRKNKNLFWLTPPPFTFSYHPFDSFS